MTILNQNFAHPQFFWLLGLIPLLIVFYIYKELKARPTLQLASTKAFQNSKNTWRLYGRHIPFVIRLVVVFLVVVALARPQSSSKEQNVNTEGIDIIISMDISTSMLAQDLKPNRLEASQKVAMEFIEARENDRIGLVVFAGESFTQAPLTTDHSVLKNLFGKIKSGNIKDGTALGEGLATAVNRIKESKAKSKVVIILTDGVNNSGSIAPITAAEIAKTFKVRVYTIGVGSQGMAPYPIQTPYGTISQNVPVEIDEASMKEIAKITGGKYFRATNNKKLKSIYQEIDKLEKTKIEVTEFRKYAEEYLPFALVACALLILEIILRYTIFRTLI
jgi:Ca-activated chloride channel family protein